MSARETRGATQAWHRATYKKGGQFNSEWTAREEQSPAARHSSRHRHTERHGQRRREERERELQGTRSTGQYVYWLCLVFFGTSLPRKPPKIYTRHRAVRRTCPAAHALGNTHHHADSQHRVGTVQVAVRRDARPRSHAPPTTGARLGREAVEQHRGRRGGRNTWVIRPRRGERRCVTHEEEKSRKEESEKKKAMGKGRERQKEARAGDEKQKKNKNEGNAKEKTKSKRKRG